MNKWYCIGFKIKWNRKSSSDFSEDLIIIDLLIVPLIKQFGSDIILWRFHRRATDDEKGHSLRFIFYGSDELSKEVFSWTDDSEFIKVINDNLLEEKVNKEIFNDGVDSEKIEVTSDKSWPIEIQKTWPYYIDGVCKMFINLMKEIKIRIGEPKDKNNFEELKRYYKKLEDEIAKYWLEYGWHSFLHHIGAIFGYEPTNPYPRGNKNGAIIL